MPREEPTTQSRFLFVGNHPCLDFINTEIVQHGERVDLLRGLDDLLTWLVQEGLLEKVKAIRPWPMASEKAHHLMEQARIFRATLRRMAEERARGEEVAAEAVNAINDLLRTRIGYKQVISIQGAYEERFLHDQSDSSSLLFPLAEAAVDLLCHADPALIKRCENPACILFFYDTTKNHARRWCSMSGCGNRAKAAAHYQRRRKGKP